MQMRYANWTKAEMDAQWAHPDVHNPCHLNAWGANKCNRGRECNPHEGKEAKARVAKLRKRLWDVDTETTVDAKGKPVTVYKARRA